MSQTTITSWQVVKPEDKCWAKHAAANASKKLFATQTHIPKTDTKLYIHELTLTSPENQSVQCSVMSFNHNPPDIESEFLQKQIMPILFEQLKVKLCSLARVKFGQMSFAQILSREKSFEKSTTTKTFEIDFYNRKTLLFWFIQYGQNMFQRFVRPTDKIIKYDGVQLPDDTEECGSYSYISQIFWVFPFSATKTWEFLKSFLETVTPYQLVDYQESDCNPEKKSYFWTPVGFNEEKKERGRKEIHIIERYWFYYRIFNEISCQHVPSEIVLYIMKFLETDEIDEIIKNLGRLDGRNKIPISVYSLVKLTESRLPVVFYEPFQKVNREKLVFRKATQETDKMIRYQKRLCLIQK